MRYASCLALILPLCVQSDLPNDLKKWFGKPQALVLSGGGSKGAFELGILESICADPNYRNSWTMITGTSIGALMAGMFAQFDQNYQCTDGLRAAREYWSKVKSADDVFQLGEGIGVASCFSVINGPALMGSFFRNGGFCDPAVGQNRYRKAVNETKIHQSDMKLWVPTASMTRRSVQWYSDQSPHIMNALLGSSAIAPLIYPMKFDSQWHVDGGIHTNTPLMKALEEGAQRALVVMLQPLKNFFDQGSPQSFGPPLDAKNIDGRDVLSFYWDTVEDEIFIYKELTQACRTFPQAEILGWFPDESLGDLTDFSRENVLWLIDEGRTKGMTVPVDLCEAIGVDRENREVPKEVLITAAGVFGFAIGSLITIIGAALRAPGACQRCRCQCCHSKAPPPARKASVATPRPGIRMLLEAVAQEHGLKVVEK